MDKPSMVSIWVGNTESETSLDEYLEMRYNRDGDPKPSRFMRDFKIKDYDEDMMESEFLGKGSASLSELLDGFSHYEVILAEYAKKYPKVVFKQKLTAVILIYNFQYKGLVDGTDDDEDNSFAFIGTVQYE